MHPFLSLAVLGISAGAVSILPSFQKHPLQSKFSRRTFAHRGLFDHLSRPENSLAAFSAAVEHGYGIELDLQMTADGKIVVFHDESLQRMCSTPLKIEQSTFAELQKHPLLNSDQTIPLFSEVLQLVDGKVPLIVEIKSTEHYEPLCLKVYDLLRRYPGDYCDEPYDDGLVCKKCTTGDARSACYPLPRKIRGDGSGGSAEQHDV